MSHDNVEVVRELLELANGRDYVDTQELFDSDVVFARFGKEFADLAGEWRGVDEMWEGIVQFFREWEDVQTRPKRFVDLGDQVLVLIQQTGRGRASGAPSSTMVPSCSPSASARSSAGRLTGIAPKHCARQAWRSRPHSRRRPVRPATGREACFSFRVNPALCREDRCLSQ